MAAVKPESLDEIVRLLILEKRIEVSSELIKLLMFWNEPTTVKLVESPVVAEPLTDDALIPIGGDKLGKAT